MQLINRFLQSARDFDTMYGNIQDGCLRPADAFSVRPSVVFPATVIITVALMSIVR